MVAGFVPGHPSKGFLGMWDHLGYLENHINAVICYESTRIQIPYMLPQRLLARLHLADLGQNMTISVANAKYFWPKHRD